MSGCWREIYSKVLGQWRKFLFLTFSDEKFFFFFTGGHRQTLGERPHRSGGRSKGLSQISTFQRPTFLGARSRRLGHVVQFGAFPLFRHGLARSNQRPGVVLSKYFPGDGPRYSILLGCAYGLHGSETDRETSFQVKLALNLSSNSCKLIKINVNVH